MTFNCYQPIHHYLPHRAPMIFLDRIISSDENQTICEVKVTSDGVLSPFLTDETTLPSWYFVEIMAQTIGVWNGLRLEKASSEPKIALLLGVRRFKSSITEALLDDTITVEANMALFDETISSFQCSLLINGKSVASASIVAYEATSKQLTIFKEKGGSL